MPVMNVARFERFFRLAAGLDVDKQDLRRYNEFVGRKIYDLMLRGEANAKANDRDVVQPWDLPITKGLQECIHDFGEIDEQVDLQPILQQMAELRGLDLVCSVETEARLPAIAGGLSVALARTFKIIDAGLKNPQGEHWDKAFRIFDLLV
jgi:hypothetical protein